MNPYTHIEGKACGKILLFALSTCVWCKKTRRLLEELGVAFDLAYVDLLPAPERKAAEQELSKWSLGLSFPTLVIDDEEVINGFDPDRIKAALGLIAEWSL